MILSEEHLSQSKKALAPSYINAHGLSYANAHGLKWIVPNGTEINKAESWYYPYDAEESLHLDICINNFQEHPDNYYICHFTDFVYADDLSTIQHLFSPAVRIIPKSSFDYVPRLYEVFKNNIDRIDYAVSRLFRLLYRRKDVLDFKYFMLQSTIQSSNKSMRKQYSFLTSKNSCAFGGWIAMKDEETATIARLTFDMIHYIEVRERNV